MAVCARCGEHNADDARFCQRCGSATAAPQPDPAASPGAAAGSRKVVSVVFCDLTGSTALGEGMDPESLRAIITRYFEEMQAVLRRHGGTVEKFIGDAVMAAFGVPVIHEDDALRAVRAAAEMQERMRAMNVDLEARWGTGLLARIGVNTGEVLAGDPSAGHGFVSGDAVNVGARLEQAAPSGEVLLGETTYKLVRDAVEVEAVEPLELKGKSEPMPAFRLKRVLEGVEGTSRRLDSPLIGRDDEFRILKDSFEEAVAHTSCKLATVFGPAGAGKSRITAEFVSSLPPSVRMMRGRCVPYGEGVTYLPIGDAVKGLCGVTDDDPPEVARSKIESFLPEGEEAAVIGDRIFSALDLSDAMVESQESFWALRMFIENLAKEHPLVIVFDDIHWAEPTMLDLLEYLTNFSRSVPILLLCLARRELLDTRPGWGAGGTTILLEPLAEAQVEGLIDHLLGDTGLPSTVRKRIIQSAEGNPLYVEEIVRMLIDDGLLLKVNGQWDVAGDLTNISIPPTINALLSARLDRLGQEEKQVLQEASVIGKTFWWGALTTLSPEELRARIAQHLQSLVRKEMIGPDQTSFVGEDAFRFSHILVRDAAYRGLPKEHRARHHEELAGWLQQKAGERIAEYEEILGYHYEQAAALRKDLGLVDDKTTRLAAEAAERLGRSGHRALDRADMPAAANLLGRAVSLLDPDDESRMRFAIELSTALMEIGDLKRAASMLEETHDSAERLGNAALVARSQLHLTLLRSFTEAEGWKEEAHQALSLVPVLEQAHDEVGVSRVYQLIAEAWWDDHDYTRTEEALEKALHHARRADHAHQTVTLLTFLAASTFYGTTHVHDAIRRIEEILKVGEGDRTLTANCLMRLAGLAAMQRQFSQARALASRGRALYDELGLLSRRAVTTQEVGLVEMLAGDDAAAEAELRAGYDALIEMGQHAFAGSSAAMLSQILYRQGRYEEAESFAGIAREAAEDAEMLKPEWAPTAARLLARRGDLAGAEALARETLEIAERTDDVLTRGESAMSLAEILSLAGRSREAIPYAQSALEIYRAKGILPLADEVEDLIGRFATI